MMQLTDDHRMIRDEVARYLDDAGGLEPARAISEGVAQPALWQGFAVDLGMAAGLVPEAAGGLGLGLVEITLIAGETGRRLAPMPFAAVAEAAFALSDLPESDARDALLARIAEGGIVVMGKAAGLVPFAAAAEAVILRDGDSLSLAEDVTASPAPVMDATRPAARVAFAATTALGTAPACQAKAQLVLAAETVGAARGAFELTQAYIAERVQFGRTIASFQAIKHRMADLYARLCTAEAMVLGLAHHFDANDAALNAAEAQAALAMAVELLDKASSEAIQLHGGVGFTWEYAPHLFFKRAQSVRQSLGHPARAYRALGQDLVAGRIPANQPAGDDSPFRREVGAWLDAHLTGRFAPLKGRGGAGDGEALPELRKDWEQELASGGWVGIGLPQAVGGRGLSVADQIVFNEEYARAGGPGRMGHIGEGLIGPTIVQWGNEDQKARHLPGILAGTTFWAQGYSEPGAGSDLGAVRTRARQDENGDWLVTGQKIWTSLAHLSDWIFVVARAEEGSVGRKGLIFLLMPLHQEGIEIRPIKQINGGAEFNEVFFDNARAKSCDVLGEVGQGWQIAMSLLGHERGISTLGQQLGFARELEDLARRASDAPEILEGLGRAWAGLRAMRYGALRTLDALARGAAGAEALTYKYEWSNWHRALGELAMDIIGPEAVAWSHDPATEALQQMYLFARSETIYGGTNEVQLNIIAEQGLAMPREPRGTA